MQIGWATKNSKFLNYVSSASCHEHIRTGRLHQQLYLTVLEFMFQCKFWLLLLPVVILCYAVVIRMVMELVMMSIPLHMMVVDS